MSVVAAGDTIYVRGGTHIYTTTITISKSGTAGAKYYMFAYPGERPILDFSGMADADSNRGVKLTGSYWYIKGLNIYKAGDNGMIIQTNASYNRIEFCNFYENRDSGLQLDNGAANNEIINCDSYYNLDSTQGDSDGFSPKLTVGTGNYFYGCRSWNNSDDAYDLYLNAPTDNVTTTFENCWAMKAGYLKNGSAGTGNGNGFKMGSATNHHNVILKNCLAFQNLKEGFDQNHNKGSMTLYNCTSFNNGGNNFEISEAVSSGYTAKVTNGISFTGSVSLAYATQTTNSWQSPFVVTSADFVSIDPSAAYGPRKADGSLPDITFMHLAAGSDLIDGGTNVGLPYCGTKPDLGCFEYCTGGTVQKSLTTSTTAGGTVTTPGIGTYLYDVNTNASIAASANANYHFVNWTGTAVTAGKVANPNAPSTSVLMDANYTVQANFAIDKRSLTTSVSAGGTVTTPGIGTYLYDYNTAASIAASANVNYHFVNWTGSAVTAGKVSNPNSPSTTVLMDANYAVGANFAIDRKIISGYVIELDTNIPFTGVSIDATNGGGSDITDVNGYYEVLVDYNWSGKIIPSKYAYAFEPNSLTYTNVTADIANQNYVGMLLTYKITGYIKNLCEVPIKSVYVEPNNGGSSYTTDVNGYYEVWVDYNWSGTVTPSKADYTFEPTSRAYTNVLADQTDQNYAATNIYDLDCSGYIGFGDVKVIADNWLSSNVDITDGDFNNDDIVNFLDFTDFAEVWLEE